MVMERFNTVGLNNWSLSEITFQIHIFVKVRQYTYTYAEWSYLIGLHKNMIAIILIQDRNNRRETHSKSSKHAQHVPANCQRKGYI